MKKLTLLFLVLLYLLSCQDNRKKMIENMQSDDYLSNGWEAMTCSAIGYPIIVYSGGFILKNKDFVGLYSASITTATGQWGEGYPTLNHGNRAPYRLETTWISLAEDCEYSISTDIDYKKIKEIFDNIKPQYRGASMKLHNSIFSQIIAGFAPGGVVVVWVSAGGTQYEIGRYQGQKVKIPQEDIDRLDNSEKIWFDKAYRKELLERPAVVTPEWREKNQGKPIPYGLWDKYRQTYYYKPIITLPEGSEIYDFEILHLNGEAYNIFYPKTKEPMEYADRTLPRFVGIDWTTKEGVDMVGTITFDEEEVLKAFEDLNPNDTLEIEYYIPRANNYIAVYLSCKEKNITRRGLAIKADIEVFESFRKYNREIRKE